jgi:Na+-transporting methylmalonyl-CoA/oxaloacetate decarboxylase gamma subunit
MNDQSSGWPPDFEDDDEEKRRAQSLQRVFMDRARRAVERDLQRESEPAPNRTMQRVIALAAALIITFGIVFVFDAFLTGMQKVMHLMDEQEARQQQEAVEQKKKEPIPAYVVPSN